ncbi:MAG: hypothetical protein ACP5NX_00225 [Candidatus Bilamarchaeaceae archaeon]
MVFIYGRNLLRFVDNGKTHNVLVVRGSAKSLPEGGRPAWMLGAHGIIEDINRELNTGLSVIAHPVSSAAIAAYLQEAVPPHQTNTPIAYRTAGARLGKEITTGKGISRVIFKTGMYAREKNIALTATDFTPADIRTEGAATIIEIPDNRLVCIPDFPKRSGLTDAIPGMGPAHIHRRNGPYAGFLAIGDDGAFEAGHIYADCLPLSLLGVVAEVPDKDIGTITQYLRILQDERVARNVALAEQEAEYRKMMKRPMTF